MSTTTSDTPRTDAEAGNILDASPEWSQTFDSDKDGDYVRSDFARRLERELVQAKAYSQQVVVNITEEMNGLKAGNARLLRELEELRTATFTVTPDMWEKLASEITPRPPARWPSVTFPPAPAIKVELDPNHPRA
jgi:hypothetical protein